MKWKIVRNQKFNVQCWEVYLMLIEEFWRLLQQQSKQSLHFWWSLLPYARFIILISHDLPLGWRKFSEWSVNFAHARSYLTIITKSFDSKPIAFAQCGPFFHSSTRSWLILLLLPLLDLLKVSNASSHLVMGPHKLLLLLLLLLLTVLMEWMECYQPCLSDCVCCQEIEKIPNRNPSLLWPDFTQHRNHLTYQAHVWICVTTTGNKSTLVQQKHHPPTLLWLLMWAVRVIRVNRSLPHLASASIRSWCPSTLLS